MSRGVTFSFHRPFYRTLQVFIGTDEIQINEKLDTLINENKKSGYFLAGGLIIGLGIYLQKGHKLNVVQSAGLGAGVHVGKYLKNKVKIKPISFNNWLTYKLNGKSPMCIAFFSKTREMSTKYFTEKVANIFI